MSKKENTEKNMAQDQETIENVTIEQNASTEDGEQEVSKEAPIIEKTIDEQLEDAKKEIEELKTKALYRQAEFENFRKRVIQEKADLILNGGTKVLETILPIVDDMERAIQNMDKTEDIDAVKEGVILILQKLQTTLKGHGVTAIETADSDFNTDYHEAIAQIPAPTPELKGKVIDCTKKGYLYNQKVLRFAQVVVGV